MHWPRNDLYPTVQYNMSSMPFCTGVTPGVSGGQAASVVNPVGASAGQAAAHAKENARRQRVTAEQVRGRWVATAGMYMRHRCVILRFIYYTC